MKTNWLIAGLLAAMLASENAPATSFLPNDADIREIDGAPAACLPPTYGESIQLERVTLMESSLRGGKEAYQWILERVPGGEPTMLRPGDCVIFGRPLSGYDKKGGLEQLDEGKTYTFVLERGDHLNRLRSHNYVGSFCVVRLPNQHLAYPAYVRHPNGTATYPPCARWRTFGPPAPDGISPPERPMPW